MRSHFSATEGLQPPLPAEENFRCLGGESVNQILSPVEERVHAGFIPGDPVVLEGLRLRFDKRARVGDEDVARAEPPEASRFTLRRRCDTSGRAVSATSCPLFQVAHQKLHHLSMFHEQSWHWSASRPW